MPEELVVNPVNPGAPVLGVQSGQTIQDQVARTLAALLSTDTVVDALGKTLEATRTILAQLPDPDDRVDAQRDRVTQQAIRLEMRQKWGMSLQYARWYKAHNQTLRSRDAYRAAIKELDAATEKYEKLAKKENENPGSVSAGALSSAQAQQRLAAEEAKKARDQWLKDAYNEALIAGEGTINCSNAAAAEACARKLHSDDPCGGECTKEECECKFVNMSGMEPHKELQDAARAGDEEAAKEEREKAADGGGGGGGGHGVQSPGTDAGAVMPEGVRRTVAEQPDGPPEPPKELPPQGQKPRPPGGGRGGPRSTVSPPGTVPPPPPPVPPPPDRGGNGPRLPQGPPGGTLDGPRVYARGAMPPPPPPPPPPQDEDDEEKQPKEAEPEGTAPTEADKKPETPKKRSPGIYVDCSKVSEAQCKAALKALNDGLKEIGITDAEFALDPPETKQLVLVDAKTKAVLTKDDPIVKKNAALSTLVNAVNGANSDFTMMVVDDAFRFPNNEEVTTTMAQPFAEGDGSPTFYFNIEAYSDYRVAADEFIRTNLDGKDPLNPTAILINEIAEAEKVHEFRTTGRVTDAEGDVVFRGDKDDPTDRRRAHRGIKREDDTRDGGHADDISTQAEGAFRADAGLPARAGNIENEFTGGFFSWPGGGSEADGALVVAFTTTTGRHEMVIYHDDDGGFARLETGRDAVRAFYDEWRRRDRERRRRNR